MRPGGQLAAMVLRLPQTPVPSPASSPASLLLPLLLLRAVYLFAHPSTLPHPHLQLLLLLLQLQSASGGIIVSAASAGLCLHSNFVWISSTSAAAAAFAAVAATVACHPRTSRHVKPFFIARAWCGLNAACMSMRRVYMCACVCVRHPLQLHPILVSFRFIALGIFAYLRHHRSSLLCAA